MKTLVYQSFRTSDVPGWVTRCMKSVRGWAADRGFDYQFFDNRFFEYAPDWYREKVKHRRLLVGDLARLELAKQISRGRNFSRKDMTGQSGSTPT